MRKTLLYVHEKIQGCDFMNAFTLKKRLASSVLMLILLGVNFMVNAGNRNDVNQTIINVSGVIIDPPECDVNAGEKVEIDFGDTVGIKKINTGIYRQPISFDLDCEKNKPSLGFSLYLSIEGVGADFDPDSATIVTREYSNLGVKIYNDGKPLPLNTPVIISAEKLPNLEAVLVVNPDAELKEGDFSAGATIKIAYN